MYITPSEISLGLHVRVNTMCITSKPYTHARLDNTQSKPNLVPQHVIGQHSPQPENTVLIYNPIDLKETNTIS